MQYFKFEGLLLLPIDEEEAKKIEKNKTIPYNRNYDEVGIKIYDVDKHNPMQLVEWLFYGKRKSKFWLYLIIGFIIFILLGFTYIYFSNKNKPEINQQPQVKTETLQTKSDPVNVINSEGKSITIIPGESNTPVLTEQSQIIKENTNNYLTQKDLDLELCRQSNKSLDEDNIRLNNEISEKVKIIDQCKSENLSIQKQVDKTNIYIGIGQQVFDRCKTTTDINIKNNCNSLISNYLFND